MHQEEVEKLRKDLTRMEYVLEGAALGAWDWWLENNRVQFDRRWCEMLGLKLEETPQNLSTWDSRVHPEDKEKVYADIKAYLNGQTAIYENIHRVKHQNGSWVWILDRGRVSERDEQGRAVRFTGTHFDITRFKEVEVLSNQIQHMAKVGGWELDVATHNTTWTEECYHIHELPVGTPTNRVNGISFFDPEDQPRISKCVEDCITNGKPYRERFRFIDAKGVRKWVEASGAPLRDAEGKIIKLRGTIQDISELVLAEERTKMERAKAMQNSKLMSLGEMSAGIAHEINNPLAIVSGGVSLIQKDAHDPDKILAHAEKVNKAIERIVKIVSGLRKFSRTSDQQKKKPESLARIMQEVLPLVEARAKRCGVSIQCDCETSASIDCNEIEIEQVMINLINNAIDAAMLQQERWVQVRCFEDHEQVVVQVVDSGRGISDSIAQHLFQPFFTTKKVGEGTGLGLSIAKGILDDHQASIELIRQRPQTCFEVRFQRSNPA